MAAGNPAPATAPELDPVAVADSVEPAGYLTGA